MVLNEVKKAPKGGMNMFQLLIDICGMLGVLALLALVEMGLERHQFVSRSKT